MPAERLRNTPGARPLALEGLFQSLGQGIGEAYLGAFALALGAESFGLGLIASVPTAGAALAQAAAGRLRRGVVGAKRYIARAWSAQALGYASLGLCLFLPAGWRIAGLCAVALVTWGLAGTAVPAWTSLVAEVVPGDRRGRFFGTRGVAQQTGILLAIVGGGLLLAALTSRGHEGLGFVVLFAAAGGARALGTTLLVQVPERARRPAVVDLADGWQLLRSSRKFRRLCLYLWALHVGTHLSGPFFVPYMLQDLGLSYAVVGGLVATPALVKALTMRFWGHLADRVGPGPLFRVAGWFVVPVAALWLVSGDPRWILAAQIYSGLAWGAFELAQAAALMQTTRGREAAVALFNLIDGAMMVTGSLLGGLAVRLFGAFGMPGYLGAIGCSSVLRAVPAAVLLWRIRDIGRPAWSLLKMPLRVWAVRPTRGPMLRPWGEFADDADAASRTDRVDTDDPPRGA